MASFLRFSSGGIINLAQVIMIQQTKDNTHIQFDFVGGMAIEVTGNSDTYKKILPQVWLIEFARSLVK